MGRRKQEEDEYEVEKISDAIVSLKYGKHIEWKYLVKWKGYSKAHNTREPAESFEDSPNLLEQFWRKADTGGRDPKKAKDFSKGEVVTLAEGAVWSEAEGDDEGEEQGGVDESASPKPRGRKRTSAPADGTPQRKRGRPSKADKVSTGKPRKESVGKRGNKSGDDENESGVDKASRRNSRRLSAKASAKMKKLGKMKRMIRGTGNPKSSSEDDDDDDDDESSASRERKDASKQGAETKSALKKRKTIIESDEDRDAEGSSHDGSLFSGDDEPEPEPVPVSEPAIQPNSAAEVAPAAQDSTDKPKEASVAPTPQDTAQKKEEPKRRQYRKAPKVVTMEDPNVKKSIEARVHGRAHEESGIFRQSSTSSGDASISPVENRGGWLVGSSSQPVRAEGGSYKPTLLTFEKGKLTSHRGSAAREAPSPTAPSGSGSAGTIPGSQVGGTMDAVAQRDTLWGESVQESNAMDTSSDFAPPIAPSATVLSRSSTEVITLEPVSNEPPPTAEELLRLSGASGAALDLPDFQAGEDTNGSIINSTAATTSTLMSMPSTSEQPSGVPAPQNTWKSSSIFGLPSSSTSFSFFEKILPSSTRHAQPAKLTIPLRLDPISSVPIILKDVTQPTFGQKLTDLLAQGQDGPPGKLFEPDVINSCVTAGNSAARVVPDEGVSDEQRAWFSKLIDELDKGVLFIVALGANSFALCSSNNHYVAQKLNVPSSLIGLSRTVIMQHITITDSTLYMTYAVLAVDLKLR